MSSSSSSSDQLPPSPSPSPIPSGDQSPYKIPNASDYLLPTAPDAAVVNEKKVHTNVTYLQVRALSNVGVYEDTPAGFRLAYAHLLKGCNGGKGENNQLMSANWAKYFWLGIGRYNLSEPYGNQNPITERKTAEKNALFRVSGKYLITNDFKFDKSLCETCAEHFRPIPKELSLGHETTYVNKMLPWPSVEELIKEYYPTSSDEACTVEEKKVNPNSIIIGKRKMNTPVKEVDAVGDSDKEEEEEEEEEEVDDDDDDDEPIAKKNKLESQS
jgi:hypothetical protein